jgi:hypothetical protein
MYSVKVCFEVEESDIATSTVPGICNRQRRSLRQSMSSGVIRTQKSCTTPKAGPLHPLPIPDDCCDSVAIDFIGPLPKDQGFNCIVTMTDHSGLDVQIVPTHTNVSAEELALLFFDK